MYGLTTCGELREQIHNWDVEGSFRLAAEYYWVWLVLFSWIVSRGAGLFVGSYDEAILQQIYDVAPPRSARSR